jgi:hypothetical protein
MIILLSLAARMSAPVFDLHQTACAGCVINSMSHVARGASGMAGFSKAQPSAPAACCDSRILHLDKCKRGGVRQTPIA